MKRSLEIGKRVELGWIDNFVDGASVAAVGELNYEYLRNVNPASVVLVEEDELCETALSCMDAPFCGVGCAIL